MKRKSQRFISPVWAQRIEVEREGDSLLVTGWGRLSGPIDSREIISKEAVRRDIFERLRRYSLRQLGHTHSESSSIYQFADATDDEKLRLFVEGFGPLAGKVISCRPEGDNSITLKVAQSLKRLRREQEIFGAAVKLVKELNRNAKADPVEMLSAMTRILPSQMRPPGGIPHIENLRNFVTPLPTGAEIMTYPIAVRFSALAVDLWCSDGVPAEDKKPAVVSLARQVLCDLLNHHSPVLVAVEGEVIELPPIPNEGIMDALYFELRRDFLANRQIGICLNCGSQFPLFRRGTKGCSPACRTALRNRKYWKSHKKSVNRMRRKQRTGGR